MTVAELLVRVGADISGLTRGLAEANAAVEGFAARGAVAAAAHQEAAAAATAGAAETVAATNVTKEALASEAAAAQTRAATEVEAEAQITTARRTSAASLTNMVTSAPVQKLANNMQMVGAGALAGFGLAAKAAIDFESAFAGVQKTVEASPAEFAALRSQLEALSARTPVKFEDLAEIAALGGQLGIQKSHLVEFTEVIAQLGVSTNLSTTQAATSFARLANIMQLPQSEFRNLGSSIVALGNHFATTESEIMDMTMRLAGAGHAVGMSTPQVLGLATAMSSLGIRSEAGGTAMSRVMIQMSRSVAMGGDELHRFAQVAGTTDEQFRKLFQSNSAGAIDAFVRGLGRLQQSGVSLFPVLEELHLKDTRVRDVMLRLAGSGDLLTRALNTSQEAWRQNTALTEEAEKRFATTASEFGKLWNQVRLLGADIGKTLLPPLRDLVQGASDLLAQFRALPSDTQEGITKIALIGSVALLAAGRMANLVKQFVDLKTAMGAASAAQGTAGLAGAGGTAAAAGGMGVLGAAGIGAAIYAAIRAAFVDGVPALTGAMQKQFGNADSGAVNNFSKATMEDLLTPWRGGVLGMIGRSGGATLDAIRDLFSGRDPLATLREKYGPKATPPTPTAPVRDEFSDPIKQAVAAAAPAAAVNPKVAEQRKQITEEIARAQQRLNELTSGGSKIEAEIASRFRFAGEALRDKLVHLRENIAAAERHQQVEQSFTTALQQSRARVDDLRAALTGQTGSIERLRAQYPGLTTAQLQSLQASQQEARHLETLQRARDAFRQKLDQTRAAVADLRAAVSGHSDSLERLRAQYPGLTTAQLQQLQATEGQRARLELVRGAQDRFNQALANAKARVSELTTGDGLPKLQAQFGNLIPEGQLAILNEWNQKIRESEALKSFQDALDAAQAKVRDLVSGDGLPRLRAQFNGLVPDDELRKLDALNRQLADAENLKRLREETTRLRGEMAASLNPFSAETVAVRTLGTAYADLSDNARAATQQLAEAQRQAAAQKALSGAGNDALAALADLHAAQTGDRSGRTALEHPDLTPAERQMLDDIKSLAESARKAVDIAAQRQAPVRQDIQGMFGTLFGGVHGPQDQALGSIQQYLTNFLAGHGRATTPEQAANQLAQIQQGLGPDRMRQLSGLVGDPNAYLMSFGLGTPGGAPGTGATNPLTQALDPNSKEWQAAFARFLDPTKGAPAVFNSDAPAYKGPMEALKSRASAVFSADTYAEPLARLQAAIAAALNPQQPALAGARAYGGSVMGGAAYLVGERGPEVFVPSSAGSIVSNDRLGGDTHVTVNMTVNTPDANSFRRSQGQLMQDIARQTKYHQKRNG